MSVFRPYPSPETSDHVPGNDVVDSAADALFVLSKEPVGIVLLDQGRGEEENEGLDLKGKLVFIRERFGKRVISTGGMIQDGKPRKIKRILPFLIAPIDEGDP